MSAWVVVAVVVVGALALFSIYALLCMVEGNEELRNATEAGKRHE